MFIICLFFFFSSRRRHTRCALVTGVQTCALPICKSHPFLKRWQTKAQRFAVTLDVRYQRGLVPLGEMMVFRHKLDEIVDRVGHPIDVLRLLVEALLSPVLGSPESPSLRTVHLCEFDHAVIVSNLRRTVGFTKPRQGGPF